MCVIRLQAERPEDLGSIPGRLRTENILFDAILAIYINSTNIPPIMIINRL